MGSYSIGLNFYRIFGLTNSWSHMDETLIINSHQNVLSFVFSFYHICHEIST